jgi:uncharacterized protein YqhQ
MFIVLDATVLFKTVEFVLSATTLQNGYALLLRSSLTIESDSNGLFDLSSLSTKSLHRHCKGFCPMTMKASLKYDRFGMSCGSSSIINPDLFGAMMFSVNTETLLLDFKSNKRLLKLLFVTSMYMLASSLVIRIKHEALSALVSFESPINTMSKEKGIRLAMNLSMLLNGCLLATVVEGCCVWFLPKPPHATRSDRRYFNNL